MKNTLVAVVVIVLVVLGAVFFIGKGKPAEAPVTTPTPSTPTPVATGELKEFTVNAKNFSFSPNTMTVKKGDTVKITFNNTEGFHDFKIDAYGVATKQQKGPATEVLEFTADQAGSFEYYCSVGTHRQMGMKGILIVTE